MDATIQFSSGIPYALVGCYKWFGTDGEDFENVGNSEKNWFRGAEPATSKQSSVILMAFSKIYIQIIIAITQSHTTLTSMLAKEIAEAKAEAVRGTLNLASSRVPAILR